MQTHTATNADAATGWLVCCKVDEVRLEPLSVTVIFITITSFLHEFIVFYEQAVAVALLD
jgi:hypothetical protein